MSRACIVALFLALGVAAQGCGSSEPRPQEPAKPSKGDVAPATSESQAEDGPESAGAVVIKGSRDGKKSSATQPKNAARAEQLERQMREKEQRSGVGGPR